jgi:hypothetical protein
MTMPHPFLADSPLLLVGFLILAVGMIIFSIMSHMKRRKDLQAWATKRGLTFSTAHEQLREEHFFGCLSRGHRRHTKVLMTGAIDDWEMKAFDYHYETYSTDSKGRRRTNHHHFSAIIVDSRFPLHHLYIRPEGIFDKVTEFVGMDDIDFESAEFSRKFYVKAKDKRWAYDVITQDTMAFMLDNARGLKIEFSGPYAIVWQNRRMKLETLDRAFTALTGMLDRIPDHIVRQQMEGIEA